MEQSGQTEIIAIVQNTAPIQCAGAISVLNHFYGRDDIPLGAYNTSTFGASLEMEQPLPYVPEIVNNWPSPVKNTSQVGAYLRMEVIARRALGVVFVVGVYYV